MNIQAPRVLIIDDDADLLATMSDTLKMKGFEISAVQTGAEALAKAKSGEFDAALIDLRLKDSSGLEVLSGIKERSPETECIMLTGHASQDSAIQALQMNAFGYFQKPYDMEQVVLSIHRAIEKRQAARTMRESEERYRAVIQSATDAIVSVDSMGNIIGWNPAAERIFGYTEEEALVLPLTQLMPERFHEEHLNGITRVLTGGEKHIIGTTVEMEGVHKDGKAFPLEISLAELKVSGEKIFTAIIRDATIRKWAEGMQKKYAGILAKRVKEMNCLYSVSELVRKPDMPKSAVLQECVHELAYSYQFPEVAVCRLTLNGETYTTDEFAVTPWTQSRAIMSRGKQAGLLEVFYLEERPQQHEGPFLEEERKVLNTVADILERYIA